MKPRAWNLLVLLGLLTFPCSAWANAGTPLMWAGMLHLAFGNALIGMGVDQCPSSKERNIQI